jgi:hypothetical protein
MAIVLPRAGSPASLTDLGYQQAFSSCQFYRDRYIDANASPTIFGISSELVRNSQLNVRTPIDDVLQNSAAGFLQGLYPPVGANLGFQKLGNGTPVEAPIGRVPADSCDRGPICSLQFQFRKVGMATRIKRVQECDSQLNQLLLFSRI